MTNLRRRTQKMLQGRLTLLKQQLSQEYARWNKNVWKSFIKEYIDWAEQTFMGRLFQARRPATEKALSQNDIRVLSTSSESVCRSQADSSIDGEHQCHVISKVPRCITI